MVTEENESTEAVEPLKVENAEEQKPEFVTKADLDKLLQQINFNVNSAITKRIKDQSVDKQKVETHQPDLKVVVETLQKRLDEKENESKQANLNSAVLETLTNQGISNKFVKAAMAEIKQDNLVYYDEDGELKFNAGKDQMPLDIKSGLSKWLKDNDHFLAPKGIKGTKEDGKYKSPLTGKMSEESAHEILGKFFK